MMVVEKHAYPVVIHPDHGKVSFGYGLGDEVEHGCAGGVGRRRGAEAAGQRGESGHGF